ncbi:MAG: hypothetical protein ACPLKV_01330 [Minisyncoccia bacterium]
MAKTLNTSAFWRYLVYFWNVLVFFIIILDFFSANAYSKLLEISCVIYIGTLSIYAGTKEFERWFNKIHYKGHHPGEVFVISWTIILIFLIVTSAFLTRLNYRLPDIIIYSYISVLTIFALTRRSRALHRESQENKTIVD